MSEQPNDFALVIGINDYPQYGVGGANLQGAVDDARDFAAWLTAPDGGGLPAAQCETILSTAAPLHPERGAVDAALERLMDAAEPVAEPRRFYFYFSGHGHADEIDDVSLCMANWSFRRRQAALSSGAYRRFIHKCLRFREVVVILDCCRLREIAATGFGSELNCPRPESAAGSSRYFIAYATEFQQAAFEHGGDGDRVRGHLTRALLEGLRGAAPRQPGGGVAAADLKAYLERRVPEMAGDHGQRQQVEVASSLPAHPPALFGSQTPGPGAGPTAEREAVTASEPRTAYPFRVQVKLGNAIDGLSRIQVSDGFDRPLDAADGSFQRDLPPGLYAVRVERGGLIAEELLRHSAEAPVDRDIPAPKRRSALPSSDSSTAPDYYRKPARRWSIADTGSGPLAITGRDDDPRLFIFVRAASRKAAAGVWVGNGLELCDRDGAILSLFGEEHAEADAADGWLAFSRRLPAGFYRLRWLDPAGSRAIALTLFKRWDTQVFLPFDGRPMVERASILLPRRGTPFDPSSRDAQSTDMGLLGLRLGRDLVPAEVHRELLYGKFDNPMLGLIGAHLLLMAREPNRDTVDLVLGNLRDNLLGDVPDVRALAWRAWQRLGGDRPAPTPFDAPPMLRAGLRAVIDADAEVGGLVPADGILSWISRHQRADTAWTSWSPPVQTRARPQPEHTARPYLLPEQQDVVFVQTAEDLDLSEVPYDLQRADRSRNRELDLTFDALRGTDAFAGLGASIAHPAVERPLDALRDRLDRLNLDPLITKSLSRPPATVHAPPAPPAAQAGTPTPPSGPALGPSLSVAVAQDNASPAEDSAPVWIDNLVKDALDSARRAGRDLDVPALARAANLPRAVIEERAAALSELVR
ncbi:caspase family protein [Thiohalocapsa sp. ML1]|uniref:caspase family protein n=1 Tax=Thiohalocapsa sp. ML1 TaxID=1431688 RepID=UPI000731FE48|nr:caspase family protein [Thiohalocapsa sp. ML1]